MEKYQIGVIATLLLASVAVLLIPALVWLIRRLAKRPSDGSDRISTVSRMLIFSAYLIVAVWCLRYAVGYFSIMMGQNADGSLTWFEEIFNSMVHTLQSFSMDEDYTTYILDGKQMMSALFGEESRWVGAYGAYASVLNVTAIIAGGAILFELLASIFPRLRLGFSYLAFWREKYYFSELNQPSLALAKSVYSCNGKAFTRPVLIFADAYVDDESENSAEKLLEAKTLGAICIRDDLAHIKKNRLGMRKFFLIDKSESANLHTLVNLVGDYNRKFLKKAEIFLFTNDDAYIQVEKSVRNKLDFKEEDMPTFIPVQSYRNLITNLLTDIPLYDPLIGKEKNADGSQSLTVTILGTGHIGTEMFLNTYWIGQILDCRLKIRVLSQESEEAFWGKIDYINPEIKRTTIEGDPILQINRKGDMAQVYCQVEYTQCDVRSAAFIDRLQNDQNHILDTNYFLVALGADSDNISAANTLRKYVGQYHAKLRKPVKTVISYVVYDPELSDTLNQEKYFCFAGKKPDVCMQAIGSRSDVYSVKNVFLTEHETVAQKASDAYHLLQNKEERANAHRNRMKNDYKHWANLARAMHVNYKIYSMGMIRDSLFDYPNNREIYDEKIKFAQERCKNVIAGHIQLETKEQAQTHLELLHKMAWLEHRRWNAFTRVKGFRGTTDYDAYAVTGELGSYKQMELKLHPCLVECDQKGFRGKISPTGFIRKEDQFKRTDRSDFDLLDDLSYDLFDKKLNDYDFKLYDYPISAMFD